MQAGEVVTPEHIQSIRPAYGLHTRYYEDIIGRTIKINVKAGTPVSFELFK